MNYSLRPATAADTEFARVTHHRAYKDAVVRQFGGWDENLQDGFFAETWAGAKFDIILSGGLQAGYTAVVRKPDHYLLKELVLLPEFQGKGIGSALIREVQEKARAEKIPVRLEVLFENYAKILYERLGFKDYGKTAIHFKMEWQPS